MPTLNPSRYSGRSTLLITALGLGSPVNYNKSGQSKVGEPVVEEPKRRRTLQASGLVRGMVPGAPTGHYLRSIPDAEEAGMGYQRIAVVIQNGSHLSTEKFNLIYCIVNIHPAPAP